MDERLEGVGVLRVGQAARTVAPHQVAQDGVATGQNPARLGVVNGHR